MSARFRKKQPVQFFSELYDGKRPSPGQVLAVYPGSVFVRFPDGGDPGAFDEDDPRLRPAPQARTM